MLKTPVVMFVYDRLDHTKKTIDALSDNLYSEDTELYIFSDGGKDIESQKKVDELRSYLELLKINNSFKKVILFKSAKNLGLAKSIIDGINFLFNEIKIDQIIVLEDDLLTSKYFLKYMNVMLNRYKYEEKIWSISAYSPPIKIPSDYRETVYLSYRSSSWGWGTWKDRWETTDWNIQDYNKFEKNKKLIKKFNRGGRDLSGMLKMQMNNEIDSWAIRWCYEQFKQNKFTIYPKNSLIYNIGLDGSGTHGQKLSEKYNSLIVETDNFDLKMPELNFKILKKFKKFYLSDFKYSLSRIKKKIF